MTVLFVDDEMQVLRGLERMLDAAEVDWDAEFVDSGLGALKLLANDAAFDTVVTDMKMPGMDGAELLKIISEEFPHIVRLVLSGEADKESVFRAVTPMHQYLSKPCDAEKLKTTIHRATALRNLLHSESLTQVVASISSLPSVPAVYQEVVKALQNENSTIEVIGRIISKDPAMTAKILQLSNSSVFGFRNPIASAAQAATLMGTETIKSLVLSVGVFQEFDESGTLGFSIDALMTHSVKVAGVARKIAIAEKLDRESGDAAFTAGVLHDIGKLALLAADPVKFGDSVRYATAKGVSSSEAELEIFGADHAGVGAHMLSIWGIPQSIIEVVALHHSPEGAGETAFSPLTAVTAANELVRKSDPESPRTQAFESYLDSIGCMDRLPVWKELSYEADE